jgi:hypothetical protein
MNLNNYKFDVAFQAFDSETNTGFLVKEEPMALKKLGE